MYTTAIHAYLYRLSIQAVTIHISRFKIKYIGHFFFEYRGTSYSIGVIIMKTEIAGNWLIKTANFFFSKIPIVLFFGMNQVFR